MKYSYDIVFSKRKCLSITISADNKITLRCPLGFSEERAKRFVNEKADWIARTIARNEKKLIKNADVISHKAILVQGEKFPLFTGSARREITDGGVFVKTIKDLKKLYIERFASNFSKLLEEISRRTGLSYNGLQIKNYKSRWGCCDGNNNIFFNYKIFMLPQNIQYYIIIHELSHTVQHNHSERFWQLVEKFVPEYKSIKKDLRNYDFLTTLY